MNEAAPPVPPDRDDSPAAAIAATSPPSSSVPHSSTNNAPSYRVPDHELLGPIASGAYGEVWLARNAVGTLRAVKIVRRDQHASAESFEREFKGLQKFEPVSRAHERLVDILQIGRNDAEVWFYYVMELADGFSNQYSVSNNQSLAPSPRRAPRTTDHCSLITGYSPRTLRADLKSRGALPAGDVIAFGIKLTAALAVVYAIGNRLTIRPPAPTRSAPASPSALL